LQYLYIKKAQRFYNPAPLGTYMVQINELFNIFVGLRFLQVYL